MVRDAFRRTPQGPAPAAVVVRDDATVDLIPLSPALVRDSPLPMLLAGLSRSVLEDRAAIAVGVIGRFRMERRTPSGTVGVPVLLSFLEWSDCRWVSWRLVLGADDQPVDDGESWHRAADGDPLPAGLGRWWSLGRRTGATLHLTKPTTPPEAVH